ncbi:Protein FAR1-RELATED SEQUENCE 9 [Linum perenne]
MVSAADDADVLDVYYPDSEICKVIHDPKHWKELTFETLDDFDAFYLEYSHEAGFSVRKMSTKTKRCPSDGVTRVRYFERGCSKEGFKPGSALDPKNGGVVDASTKQRNHAESRVGCKTKIKMHDQVGVLVRETFDFLANRSGGRDKVGCSRQDLQNHRDFIRRTPLKNGEGAWFYDFFMGVKDKDPTFFYKVYTPKIFHKFQYEFGKPMDLIQCGSFPNITQGGDHVISWYRINFPDLRRVDEHVVQFNLDAFTYRCTCLLFDLSGWLCRHILKTIDTISMLGNIAARTIPSMYLKRRWFITAKIGGAIDRCSVECVDMETQFGRFQRVSSIALPLATDASIDISITDFVHERMSQLRDEVLVMIKGLQISKPISPSTPELSASSILLKMNCLHVRASSSDLNLTGQRSA